MWHRKVRRLGWRHRIILGLLFLLGLRICFPLCLLTQRLLRPACALVRDSTLTRWRVAIVRALHPVLVVGKSCHPVRRQAGRLPKLILLLRCYNILRVQEARRMKHIGPRAVQLSLALSRRTLGEGLRTKQDVVLVGLVEVGRGLRGTEHRALPVVGRTVRNTSVRHGVWVLHLELVALREDGAVGASIATRGLRALLAVTQAQVLPSGRSRSTCVLRYILKLRWMLRRLLIII